MKIVVTGGAGFIGSHLCTSLLNQGHEVTCVDNMMTGDLRNLAKAKENPKFKVLEHDIVKPFDIPCEQIYNFACPASPPAYQRDPIHTTMTCVQGSLNVLELAKKYKARVMQASTSEVYGDPAVHPQKETYFGNVNPIGPRACYDEGKRCAETLFFDAHRKWGLEIKVIRIFNTYGPNMDPEDGRVVSNFIVQALQGKDLTVYGEGEQTRSFCYVSDLVDGILKMMASPKEFTGPVNLGNPIEMTMIELAEHVLRFTGSKSKLIHKPLPPDDPTRRKPDIALANRNLGWAPHVKLEQGVKETIEYFKDRITN
jgi:UDP-glucuronate decarboxylase